MSHPQQPVAGPGQGVPGQQWLSPQPVADSGQGAAGQRWLSPQPVAGPGQGVPGQQWPPQPYAAEPGAPQGQFVVVACRCCGSVPAAPVTFRGHQGFVIVMRFLSQDGPFCRDCGMATFRQMTARTLVQGWYGWASFLITPITVLANLVKRGKVAHLAPPQPNPYGPSRPPMDPGPRLLRRPMTVVGLAIPVVLVMLIILAISQDA